MANLPDRAARNRFPGPFWEVLFEIPIGVAQIMLQPSHLVGMAFLIGVFWNSWSIASVGVIGCVAGISAAIALDFPEQERRDGLYGFNGMLVGLGSAYFYQISLPLVVSVIIGGVASSIIMNRMLRLGLKPFTFPFVVVTWFIFALLSVRGWATPTSGSSVVQPDVAAVDALSRGVGQVLFQEDIVTGMILFLAIAAHDRTQGIYVAAATSLGLIGALLLGFPVAAINMGLFGYNGVLCAIVFSGRSVSDCSSAVAAIVLSILVVRAFHVVELPAFTFPFVFSSWIVLWARGLHSKAIGSQ